MHTHLGKRRSVPALAAAWLIVTALVAPTAASGQAELEDLVDYTIPENVLEGQWIDPVIRFDLNPAALETLDDFDVASLSESRIFAAGVELQNIENDPTTELANRHTRVLQVIEALDREISSIETQLEEREPEVNTLLSNIRVEEENIERLDAEISVRERAIAEFAIRAFIGEDRVELVLNEPDTEFGKARVVSDEVRDDHRAQIATRERDKARRVETTVLLEAELETVRQELRTLREDRVQRLADKEEAEALSEQTEATYQLALHTRLPEFVAGTDIQFVALNAYVIAARTLEIEDPGCQIHWSMLAGIGRIESFHGNFGNSTLDINGHTTEDIRGLPLDGRILSGAEFVEEGADAPTASGRTEDTVVTIETPGSAAVESAAEVFDPTGEPLTGAFQDSEPVAEPEVVSEPAPEPAPAPSPEPAPAPTTEPLAPSAGSGAGIAEAPPEASNDGATNDGASNDGVTNDGASDAEIGEDSTGGTTTSGVVKTLALILDSDNGVLDGDTVYDRAVGPMQFIPTTWRLFDADGNGDGETDPQNIYDAALASARYLCASTSTMATAAGEQRAYFAYNHDLDYSRNVTNAGRGYRTQISIEDPEIPDGQDLFYRGILEASGAEERVEVDEDLPLVDLAQLRVDLASINLPTW